MAFSKALILWKHLEGGFVVDQGGETICGIRKDYYLAHNPGAPWPPTEIEHANYLHKYYWEAANCGELSEPEDAVLFQWYGNDQRSAIEGLQIVVGELPDGNLGPVTLKAMRAYGKEDMTDRLLDMQAMHYLTKHPHGDPDFKGLQNRVARVRTALNKKEI